MKMLTPTDGDKRLTGSLPLLSILSIAAGRCVANGSTALAHPDPFWAFPVIVLLGESENRLACILASIPIFWPVVEKAAERFQDLYRILVTHEFAVGSSRILPSEVRVQVGAYEAPHWAEDHDGAGAPPSRGRAGGRAKGDESSTEAEMYLPSWPSSSPEPASEHRSGSQEMSAAEGGEHVKTLESV